MSKFYYDLYCDESGTDKNDFHFGAIHCSRARATRLDKAMQNFRVQNNLIHELKWTKVSKTFLAAYIEFVDIFLDDQYTTFVLSSISKGAHWRRLASSNDSRFLHAYFHFLEHAMWASARYAVFLDATSSKRYKFTAFHYALNLLDIRYHRQKKVHTFHVVHSHENNMIQLVDVLLGALTSKAEAAPKVALATYVQQKIRAKTKFGRPKLVAYDWVAPATRRFKPHI
jgi:hypothetical protein